jgi:V8-like Glu-specific endopeptidase
MMKKEILGDTPRYRRVEAVELQQSPWITICAIELKNPEGITTFLGTGWLAAERTVITAAHVVWAKIKNDDLRVQVTFPSSGDSFSVARENIKVHDSYTSEDTGLLDFFDIAALKLPSSHSPTLLTASFVSDTPVEVAGFPNIENGPGEFVTQRAEAVRSISKPELLLHRADTLRGHSGAPVAQSQSSGASGVVGIHIQNGMANPDEAQFGVRNVALLLREDLANFIHKCASS